MSEIAPGLSPEEEVTRTITDEVMRRIEVITDIRDHHELRAEILSVIGGGIDFVYSYGYQDGYDATKNDKEE